MLYAWITLQSFQSLAIAILFFSETVKHYCFECDKYGFERLGLINSLLKRPNIYKSLNELNALNLLTSIPEISCEENETLTDIIIEFIRKYMSL